MARTPKVVEDRREQIIDAAMRVFSEKGFTRATNKDIARAAGITPGLIYYYFESKEDVLKAIVEQRSPLRLVSSLPPEVFTLPPEQFLRLLIRQILHIVENENFIGLIRVLLPEIIHASDPHIMRAVTEVFQRISSILGRYFESKIAIGEIRPFDTTLLTQMLIGCVISFVFRRHILRDPLALDLTHEQIADVVVDTIVQGIAPR